METHRRESLCAPRSRKGPVPHSEVVPRNRGKLEGITVTAVRGSRRRGGGGGGGGDSTWVGPPPSTRKLGTG